MDTIQTRPVLKKKKTLSHHHYTLSGIKIRRVAIDSLNDGMREAITLSISHQILEQFELLGNLGHVWSSNLVTQHS